MREVADLLGGRIEAVAHCAGRVQRAARVDRCVAPAIAAHLGRHAREALARGPLDHVVDDAAGLAHAVKKARQALEHVDALLVLQRDVAVDVGQQAVAPHVVEGVGGKAAHGHAVERREARGRRDRRIVAQHVERGARALGLDGVDGVGAHGERQVLQRTHAERAGVDVLHVVELLALRADDHGRERGAGRVGMLRRSAGAAFGARGNRAAAQPPAAAGTGDGFESAAREQFVQRAGHGEAALQAGALQALRQRRVDGDHHVRLAAEAAQHAVERARVDGIGAARARHRRALLGPGGWSARGQCGCEATGAGDERQWRRPETSSGPCGECHGDKTLCDRSDGKARRRLSLRCLLPLMREIRKPAGFGEKNSQAGRRAYRAATVTQ